MTEAIPTMKEEPPEDDAVYSKSTQAEHHVIDIDPVSLQYPYGYGEFEKPHQLEGSDCVLKSEVYIKQENSALSHEENKTDEEEKLTHIADATKIKRDSANGQQNETAGEMFLEKQGCSMNISECTEQKTVLVNCNLCSKEFLTQTDVITHRCIHEVDVLNSCFQKKSRSDEKIFNNLEESYTINNINSDLESGESCSQKGESNVHSNTHKPFSCSFCGKSFRKKYTLNVHVTIHSDEKPFSCNVCRKSFSQKGHFNEHMTLHTGENLYSCSVCGKTFSKKYNYKIHQTVHTVEKPFTCNVCGNSFNTKRILKIHMNTHADQKPFTCDVCGKSFAQKGYFRIHMTTHTGEKPFLCTVCGKSFNDKSVLNRHTNIHTDKKPFTCNVCNKSFTQKGHLATHMSIHSGVKPFSCTVCSTSKSFSTKSALNRHIINVHAAKKQFELPDGFSYD